MDKKENEEEQFELISKVVYECAWCKKEHDSFIDAIECCKKTSNLKFGNKIEELRKEMEKEEVDKKKKKGLEKDLLERLEKDLLELRERAWTYNQEDKIKAVLRLLETDFKYNINTN